jgi:uncharacterized lipoprotein YmbA
MAIAFRFMPAFIALVIGACASSPVTLVVLPPPAVPASDAGQAPGGTILLRQVSVPGYLEDFPVVVGRAGSALVVSRTVEWGEPLLRGVARVLRDALAQRLGASRILIAGERRIPDAELTIEFLSLEPRDGALNLDARWFFSCRTGSPGGGGRTRLEVEVASAEPQAVANATTNGLARFADELAAGVQCEPSSAIPPET